MSRVRVHNYSISIDGYGAGPNQSQKEPLGVGGESLHDWIVNTRSWNKRHGGEGGTSGVDDDVTAGGSSDIGAWIMGRNMFGPVRGASTLGRRLDALEGEILQPPGAGFGDAPKLTTRLATLIVKASNAQARPTRASLQLADDLGRRIAAVRMRFAALERSAALALPRATRTRARSK